MSHLPLNLSIWFFLHNLKSSLGFAFTSPTEALAKTAGGSLKDRIFAYQGSKVSTERNHVWLNEPWNMTKSSRIPLLPYIVRPGPIDFGICAMLCIAYLDLFEHPHINTAMRKMHIWLFFPSLCSDCCFALFTFLTNMWVASFCFNMILACILIVYSIWLTNTHKDVGLCPLLSVGVLLYNCVQSCVIGLSKNPKSSWKS